MFLNSQSFTEETKKNIKIFFKSNENENGVFQICVTQEKQSKREAYSHTGLLQEEEKSQVNNLNVYP